jgi:hypothetical protein
MPKSEYKFTEKTDVLGPKGDFDENKFRTYYADYNFKGYDGRKNWSTKTILPEQHDRIINYNGYNSKDKRNYYDVIDMPTNDYSGFLSKPVFSVPEGGSIENKMEKKIGNKEVIFLFKATYEPTGERGIYIAYNFLYGPDSKNDRFDFRNVGLIFLGEFKDSVFVI